MQILKGTNDKKLKTNPILQLPTEMPKSKFPKIGKQSGKLEKIKKTCIKYSTEAIKLQSDLKNIEPFLTNGSGHIS